MFLFGKLRASLREDRSPSPTVEPERSGSTIKLGPDPKMAFHRVSIVRFAYRVAYRMTQFSL
jgi:hypothetical protein